MGTIIALRSKRHGGRTSHGKMLLLLRHEQPPPKRHSCRRNPHRLAQNPRNGTTRQCGTPRRRRGPKGLLRSTTHPILLHPRTDTNTASPRHGPRDSNPREAPVDRTEVSASIAAVAARAAYRPSSFLCQRGILTDLFFRGFGAGGGRIHVRTHHGTPTRVSRGARRTEREARQRIRKESTRDTETVRVRRLRSRLRFGFGRGWWRW
mmetsp:Transcript_23800/g.50482  ORF Transcript_23800/g.50482 Transcript_23800/m.50482 type:complete len:207 (-) Transcript_23800:532-1152(-)